MTCEGAMPAHDPAMQRAAVPAMWGLAMLVPEIVLYPPCFQLERMQTPGAAIVWPSSLDPAVVKLEKSAAVSSTSLRHVAPAPPPGRPLKSATAVTVSTSLYAAGTNPL